MNSVACGCVVKENGFGYINIVYCPMHSQAPAMREALDNVTASLETCLMHFGKDMPEADRITRERVSHEARAILNAI